MLVTITTTQEPATDLGFLLFKHPERAQTFELNVGEAHVFYPEASEGRCTAALAVDVNGVEVTRNSRYLGESAEQYVNDRPYTANSLTAVAIGRVFSTAMSGRSEDRPELAEREIPLEIGLAAVDVRGDDDLPDRLFGPEYTREEQLDELRQRNVTKKGGLALREFALGIEALRRFVEGEPLWRVHECIFGVLALESEPVDSSL